MAAKSLGNVRSAGVLIDGMADPTRRASIAKSRRSRTRKLATEFQFRVNLATELATKFQARNRQARYRQARYRMMVASTEPTGTRARFDTHMPSDKRIPLIEPDTGSRQAMIATLEISTLEISTLNAIAGFQHFVEPRSLRTAGLRIATLDGIADPA